MELVQKKSKNLKCSGKESAELTSAAKAACANPPAGALFDEAMAVARRIRDERHAAGQQTRTE
jgi:hypothetical protein